MSGKTLVLVITIVLEVLFLTLFLYRNIRTARKVSARIRQIDGIVASSIFLSALILLLPILNQLFPRLETAQGLIGPLDSLTADTAGLIIIACALLLGFAASSTLGKNWRVGVIEDQTTELVQTGLYRFSRNPYFLSYYLMFIGFFLLSPTLLIGASILAALFVFDSMIRREERYLERVLGKEYLKYKARVRRYLTIR